MRNSRIPFLFTLISLSLPLLGQPEPTAQTTLRFDPATSEQDRQDIATAIDTTSDIRGLSLDENQQLHLSGTPEQIALGEWLFNELTRPREPQDVESSRKVEYIYEGEPHTPEKALASTGGPENVVRLFRLMPELTVQEFQELTTAARTISDIRRVYAFNPTRMVLARGSRPQIDMVEWLFSYMDQPADQIDRNAPAPSFTTELGAQPAPHPKEDTLTILYADPASTVRQFQEITTLLRTLTGIRRVYAYNGSRTIALRGTAHEAQLTEWLMGQIKKDNQPVDLGVLGYRDAGEPNPGEAIRLFRTPAPQSVQQFEAAATQARSAAGTPALFAIASLNLIGVRGTLDQIQKVSDVLNEAFPQASARTSPSPEEHNQRRSVQLEEASPHRLTSFFVGPAKWEAGVPWAL